MEILECHSKGDKKFSAFYAKININGKFDSIENIYQNSKRLYGGNISGKGNPIDYILFDGKMYPKEYLGNLYDLLWVKYFQENPHLLKYARTFDDYRDIFKGKSINNQEDTIRRCAKEGLKNVFDSCKDFSDLLKSKEKIPTLNKDILESNQDIIGHQTNCKGVMGTGVAKGIRDKYPEMFKEYKVYCNADIEVLGTAQFCKVYDGKIIANLFGQYTYGRDSRKTDYERVEDALKILHDYAISNKLSVSLPYNMGCMNAGGDWSVVEEIISRIFYDWPIVLYKK